MFISIRELELHQVKFQEDFPELDIGPDIRQKTPIRTTGHAELIREQHGHKKQIEDIRVVGEFSTRLELSCARCLDPITRDIGKSFDLLYRPQGSDAGNEELSVTQADADIGYYKEGGLLLEDLLREQILLAVPLKAVCSEECRGLCPQCGRNLNAESCGCVDSHSDPRWAELEKIKGKLPGSAR
jgi:uncharacterized protein